MRVLIVDDVISAGTSVRESVNHIHASGAVPCGLGIALDRMERGNGALSATQEVNYAYGIKIISIVDLDDIMNYLRNSNELAHNLPAMEEYRERYGIAASERHE